jgi:serine/threonine-protein kinase
MAGLTGQRIGRYEILEQIGRGGMAAVYRAFDQDNDRYVAIKVVAPHLSEDPNFEQRFRLEAQVLRDLRHPNIMPVEDYGELEGYAYLVMPFLKVGTLTDRLIEGPVSPSYGALLVQQIAEALQYLHDEGVVHRDVKPSNILLDEQGNALISDLGLARLQESHASLTGAMMVGTPAFISPEQARGEKANVLSDQYSLGVILYLLTTGELPFDAETPLAVAIKHISEPLPTIQTVSPNVPETVERVILRATAKDPGERFGSVSEMNFAFQAAMSTELAGSRAELMRAEQVQTAVVLTLQAAEAYPSATPLASEGGAPTEEVGTTFLTPESLFMPTPSKTPLPTPIMPTPSKTPLPTPTAVATAAPIISPSPTPSANPPSPTPAIDFCAGISIGGFAVNGSKAIWQLANGGSEGVTLSKLVLDWPSVNGTLKKVRLGGSLIWNQGDDAPETDIQSGWKGNRSLPAGAAKTLSFEFGAGAEPASYSLDLEFDSGCELSAGG